jgi:hypothetical protein
MEPPAAGALDGAVAEAKAYLRIDGTGEDALIERLARAGSAILPAAEEWTRLPLCPVRSIGALIGLPAEGAFFALAAGRVLGGDAGGVEGDIRRCGGRCRAGGRARWGGAGEIAGDVSGWMRKSNGWS